MFKRFVLVIIAMFILSLAALTIFWRDPPGMELYSDVPLITADRIIQDLGGKWDSYTSLREAWAQETRLLEHGEEIGLQGLIQVNSIVLPSDKGFHVAAKRFRVTGSWGFKTAQLVLEGLYGKARVFLNGIDEVNILGEVEGAGGTYTLEISPVRLDFSRENILYLELSPADIARTKLFGWLWPELGRITGQIRLEAVTETTIDISRTAVSYDPAQKQIKVGVNIRHHQSLGAGPWSLSGVLKDQEEKIGECLLPFNTAGQYTQKVDLVFTVPDAKLWSLDNPALYELELTLGNNHGAYDRVQMPIGVRDKGSNPAQGLLNSPQIAVKGQIITQAQEYNLRNKRQITEFMNELKGEGFNLLYFMGFFPSEEWLYTADRLGMGVWLELPVNLTNKGKLPSPAAVEDLILLAEHHPSVLAWTAGKVLEPSAETQEYLQQTQKRINSLPVYNLILPGQERHSDTREILLDRNGMTGEWGQIVYKEAAVGKTGPDKGWAGEKALAISWLAVLLFLTIQYLRNLNLGYKDLMNPSPKRKIRRALFWNSLGFVSRMFTLGAIITSLLFRFPPEIPYWLPYDSSILLMIQSQNPYILWLFCSLSLTLLRMLQVGLAASSFSEHPETFGLCCWLERRYHWLILVGMAWVGVSYGLPWFTPLAVYIFLTIILLPLRVRDVWKAGGKYAHLMFLPLTVLAVVTGILLWQREDLFYLVNLIRLQIQF